MGRHGFFTVEQMASRYGVEPDTIQHYASKGLLIPVHLHDGVFYTPGDFIRMEVILKAKRLGFSLAGIKRLMEGVRHTGYVPPPPLVSG